jgi:hypothetical protein
VQHRQPLALARCRHRRRGNESRRVHAIGQAYLADTRAHPNAARAASIASYEDGGLEAVFKAILDFAQWDGALLLSFEHFLAEHVRFDSDPDQGHGALSRHIPIDDAVLPLWQGFFDLLLTSVPSLSRTHVSELALASN